MDLISRAHAQQLLIYGATIMPFGGDTSGSPSTTRPAHEMVRQQVNTCIKTAGIFDGVIDFDAAITDSGNPAQDPGDLCRLVPDGRPAPGPGWLPKPWATRSI